MTEKGFSTTEKRRGTEKRLNSWLPDGRTLLASGFSTTATRPDDPTVMALYLAAVGR